MKSATHSKAITLGQMSVKPWKDGWLVSHILSGLKRWSPSLGTTVKSVRISGGMTVVTYKAKTIWNGSSQSLIIFPKSSSGYRLANDSLSNVWWHEFQPLETCPFKSVTHSFADLDDIAVSASPTLQALRRECQLRSGERE